jgi:glycosyltransferase involved in cell wall biosynthesis
VPSGQAPLVSVVMPVKDRVPSLRLALACLAGQHDIARAQVIVVNDGEPEPAASTAAQAGAGMDLTIVPGPRRGRASARNAGVAHATASHLIFLDSDILVSDHFLSAHLAAADSCSFGHGVLRELPAAERLLGELADASATEIRLARDRIQNRSAGPRYRLVANALERAIEAMDDGAMPDIAPWLGCVGANVGVPRREWELAGGFDEAFGLAWGCEDLELGFRLHSRGLRRKVIRSAAGIHLSHARLGRWGEHARNLDLFAAKHPVPSVKALTALLSAEGTPRRYAQAVAAARADSQATTGPGEPTGASSAPGSRRILA